MGKLKLKEWKFLAIDLTADTGRIQIHVCLTVQESLSKHCFCPTACTKIIRVGGMWRSHQPGSGMSPWILYGWMRVTSQLSVLQKGSDQNQRGQFYLWERGKFSLQFWKIYRCVHLLLMPSRALWGSWAWRLFCPPFHVGKTPASMTFSEFQRSEWIEVKLLSRVWLFATLSTVAYQAPLSMGFSKQEYWSGLPFPSPGDLPDPGVEPGSPGL